MTHPLIDFGPRLDTTSGGHGSSRAGGGSSSTSGEAFSREIDAATDRAGWRAGGKHRRDAGHSAPQDAAAESQPDRPGGQSDAPDDESSLWTASASQWWHEVHGARPGAWKAGRHSAPKDQAVAAASGVAADRHAGETSLRTGVAHSSEHPTQSVTDRLATVGTDLAAKRGARSGQPGGGRVLDTVSPRADSANTLGGAGTARSVDALVGDARAAAASGAATELEAASPRGQVGAPGSAARAADATHPGAATNSAASRASLAGAGANAASGGAAGDAGGSVPAESGDVTGRSHGNSGGASTPGGVMAAGTSAALSDATRGGLAAAAPATIAVPGDAKPQDPASARGANTHAPTGRSGSVAPGGGSTSWGASATESTHTSTQAAVPTAAPTMAASTVNSTPVAVTAPAAAPPPFATAQPDIAGILSQLRGAGDGTYRLRAQVHPAELGAVSVVATVHGGAISVTLTPDQTAQQAISQSLTQLRQHLADQGFTGVDVGLGSPQQSPDQDGRGDRAGRGTHTQGSDHTGGVGSADEVEVPSQVRRRAAGSAALDRML